MDSFQIERLYTILMTTKPIFKKKKKTESFYIYDTDYYNYFDFILCKEYINDICEYLEHEYGLINNYESISSIIDLSEKNPIIIDFEENKLIILKQEKNKHSKNFQYKKMYVYECLINNISIYSPTLIATNSIYLKPIILLLHTKYNNIEGCNYILYRFLDWASSIISFYSFYNNERFITNVLSLPFHFTFIDNKFFVTQKVKDENKLVCYSQIDCQNYICQKWPLNEKLINLIKQQPLSNIIK
uniref:Uncharacterized protein n=1 Tax=Faxonius propinquus nudivirus TaxID=3139431 RepID=A0AAU8GC09_9VIRU